MCALKNSAVQRGGARYAFDPRIEPVLLYTHRREYAPRWIRSRIDASAFQFCRKCCTGIFRMQNHRKRRIGSICVRALDVFTPPFLRFDKLIALKAVPIYRRDKTDHWRMRPSRLRALLRTRLQMFSRSWAQKREAWQGENEILIFPAPSFFARSVGYHSSDSLRMICSCSCQNRSIRQLDIVLHYLMSLFHLMECNSILFFYFN